MECFGHQTLAQTKLILGGMESIEVHHSARKLSSGTFTFAALKLKVRPVPDNVTLPEGSASLDLSAPSKNWT